MPVATNMAELEKQLKYEIELAMNNINKEAIEIMKQETQGFYAGGHPKMYVRTGALGKTPKTDGVQPSGKGYKIKYYLNHRGYKYNTGDCPGMLQVLKLADRGEAWTTRSGAPAKPTVGMSGFWECADEHIKYFAYEEFANRFS